MIVLMPDYSDIFESDADALVNPVNCVGAMGAGLAKAFRDRYPEMFSAYLLEVGLHKMKIGHCHTYRLPPSEDGDRWIYRRYIINLPTKYHWNDVSRLEHVKAGVVHLREVIEGHALGSVAIPALGCGFGKLEWPAVYKLLTETLDDLDCEIEIYPPEPKEAKKNG